MLNWNEYLQLLAGLVSVVNPIGAIPIFIGMTVNRSPRESRRIAWVCAFSVAMVLFVALIAGEPILHFLGISLAAFRVAGGLLVLFMGMSMLHVSDDRSRHTPEEQAESFEKDSIAVVPLAIPLLSGPGAISTIIVYAHSQQALMHYLLVSLVILSVAGIVLTALLAARPIAEALGHTGMNVVTRVMGLLLTSIAIEFIAKGIKALFPVLAG
ncbi:MAG: NAAT family transporter [Methylomonas sp.]|jgi:multiple antibiotic resistance protein